MPAKYDFILRNDILCFCLKIYFALNYRDRPGVFVASKAAGFGILLQPNRGMKYEAGANVKDDHWVTLPNLPTNFCDCIHWPITRGHGTSGLTNLEHFTDGPTHTFLGFADNAPDEVQDNGSVTWRWLSGIPHDDDKELRECVRGWLKAIAISGADYDTTERAYIVKKTSRNINLAIPEGEDVYRPSIIIREWESADPQVRINGVEASDIVVGIERSLGGVQTVVTFQRNLGSGDKISIS